jgi:hypothetical protein
VLLAAWRGESDKTHQLRAAIIPDATSRGEGFAVEAAEWAAATLHIGKGEYADAVTAAQRAYDPDGLGFNVWVLPELIEAAARNGDHAVARAAFEQLAERSSLSSTEWARGIEARSRALLTEGQEAEDLYREAIEQLGRSRVVVHHARAQLIYGEWLRREHRHVDARGQLKAAHAAFDEMGAYAFAERAQRELLATGETVRKRTADHERCPHSARSADRPPGLRRPHQPRDRPAAVPQPPHRRVASAQSLHQAGHQFPPGTDKCTARLEL